MERTVITEEPSIEWQDAFERRVSIVIGAALKEQSSPRAIADGLKLALQELAHEDTETLRKILMEAIRHLGDGASKWVGGKILAMLTAALMGALLWLAARKW